MRVTRPRTTPTRLVAGLLIVAVAVGIAIRWRFGLSPAAGYDSDEAVVGLVADRNLDGHLSAFYPSQEYGGTLGTFPVSAAQLLLGRSFVALRISAFIESIAVMALVTLLAVRSKLDHRAALAVVALWPLSFVAFSVREMLFYNTAVLLGCGVWLLALDESESPRRRRLVAVAIGLLSGLALWTTAQAAILVLAPIVLYVSRLVRSRWFAGLALAAVAGVVGLLPWLDRNLSTGFASLDQNLIVSDPPSYARRVLVSARALVFQPFGDVPTTARDLLPDSRGTLVLGLAFVVVAAIAVARRRDALTVAVYVAFPLIAAINPLAGVPAAQYRYVFIVWPALVLLCALVASHSRLLAGVLVVLLVGGITQSWQHQLPWSERRNDVVAAVGDELVARDLGGVLASYWDAHAISYVCEECPTLVPFAFVRDLDATRPAHVSYVLSSIQAPLGRVTESLTERSVPFEVIELATPGFALVHTLVPIDAATFAGGDLGA